MSYTSYRKMETAIRNLDVFDGNSAAGRWADRSQYIVFSYNTPIAEYDRVTGIWAINPRKYSVTTSRLQNIIRRAWADKPVIERAL